MYRQDIVNEALQYRRELLRMFKSLGDKISIDKATEVTELIQMMEAVINHQLNFLRNDVHEIDKLIEADVGDYFELTTQKSNLEQKIFTTEKELEYE